MAMHMRMPHVSMGDVVWVLVALVSAVLVLGITVSLPTIIEFIAIKIQAWAQNNFGYTYN